MDPHDQPHDVAHAHAHDLALVLGDRVLQVRAAFDALAGGWVATTVATTARAATTSSPQRHLGDAVGELMALAGRPGADAPRAASEQAIDVDRSEAAGPAAG